MRPTRWTASCDLSFRMRLEDYGYIGDNQTGALIGANGSMDWLCVPRFDSDACFASLLGNQENGKWQIAPASPVGVMGKQCYRGETLILETTFETESGKVSLVDFMPPREHYPEVVRIVKGMEGRIEMRMLLIIRFNYGLTVPWVRNDGGFFYAVAGPDALILRSDVEVRGEGLTTVADFALGKGQQKSFVLAWYPSHLRPPHSLHPDHALTETESFWGKWVKRCTYEGPFRQEVVRSLITLKGLIYAPTGGIIAAATTSLPEQLGGVRNWDYRYCWLRDATFTLYALMQSGYSDEASAWITWLLRAIAGDPAQMQIMYGVAGERGLIELEQKHLGGYEHSVPVRIGNAAAGQFQLDVYGEVMDALHVARSVGIRPAEEAWRLQKHLIDFVENNWDKPDDGIWEIRGPRRHFTHSKVMAWVAMDRAVKGVKQFGLEGDVEHWKSVRDAIHDDICRNGYNPKRGAFTQYYGSEKLDASLLLIPLVGFLPPTDERVISTVQLIEKELMNDGFVMRYLPSASSEVDGLPPGEGAFLPCSFWLADALTLIGQQQKAKELFNRLLTVSSSLGLISEEYDAQKKRQVGNLPQAFSHVGQINTARNLSQNDGPAKHRSNL